MSEMNPLMHYDYTRLDIECCCPICVEWRQKRTEYESIRKFVHHHSRSCFCWKCCRFRELQIEYLAIQNKRDVYCEISWHSARWPYGARLMGWLKNRLLESEETDGWWAKTSPVFSLGHWVWMFKEDITARAALASGATRI